MDRYLLLDILSQYETEVIPSLYKNDEKPAVRRELSIIKTFRRFIAENPDCLYRTCTSGHITTSSLAVSFIRSEIILTLHRKLKKWLQLGGHADGNPQLWESAKREAQEESGIIAFNYVCPIKGVMAAERITRSNYPLPVDIDIHFIPARQTEPEHFHFDVRYILATKERDLQISDESEDLKWFNFAEALEVCREDSMSRQVSKITDLSVV